MTRSDDTVTQGRELVTWGRDIQCVRSLSSVCVRAQKPDFRRLEQVLPLCGIVWPLPGSQGIKSSLQSPNLDFLLFRCVIFQLRNNGLRVSFGEIILITMQRQQKQMICDEQAQLRSTVFGDRNPDLVCPLGLCGGLPISEDYAEWVNKLALQWSASKQQWSSSDEPSNYSAVTLH